jgi:hypothetical protein
MALNKLRRSRTSVHRSAIVHFSTASKSETGRILMPYQSILITKVTTAKARDEW